MKIDMQPAEIKFLGIWDTVPGSLLKDFGDCKEKEDQNEGDRYKSDSYPPLRKIVHAVSIDEKRTKFKPLLVCPPINPKYTMINEVWFPGAHADVGGGYDDSSELSGISLNWMLKILDIDYKFNKSIHFVPENPKGLAHWSIGDKPANTGSECEDRKIPENAVFHQSYDERKSADSVPLLVKDKKIQLKYPVRCKNIINTN